MKIAHLNIDPQNAESVRRTLELLPPQTIACNNWAADYPYAPRVVARMFHTGDMLILRFDVQETYTLAVVTEDQGAVWTDSCVEFFLALDGNGYYNFEANAIGTLLLAFRKERPTPDYAPEQIMQAIGRTPTLDRAPFAERQGDNRWSLTLTIPARALFGHNISSWHGLKARMNLYKCGDNLSHPHFLSWQPISTPQPDFHRTEYFGDVEFE